MNAQVTSGLSVFFIVVSILSFCLKTHPSMRVPVLRNTTFQSQGGPGNPLGGLGGLPGSLPGNFVFTGWLMEKVRTEPHAAFFHFECACNAWFTFELVTR